VTGFFAAVKRPDVTTGLLVTEGSGLAEGSGVTMGVGTGVGSIVGQFATHMGRLFASGYANGISSVDPLLLGIVHCPVEKLYDPPE
jgi:hypothetical protein